MNLIALFLTYLLFAHPQIFWGLVIVFAIILFIVYCPAGFLFSVVAIIGYLVFSFLMK